jgi:hypothetical protein
MCFSCPVKPVEEPRLIEEHDQIASPYRARSANGSRDANVITMVLSGSPENPKITHKIGLLPCRAAPMCETLVNRRKPVTCLESTAGVACSFARARQHTHKQARQTSPSGKALLPKMLPERCATLKI